MLKLAIKIRRKQSGGTTVSDRWKQLVVWATFSNRRKNVSISLQTIPYNLMIMINAKWHQTKFNKWFSSTSNFHVSIRIGFIFAGKWGDGRIFFFWKNVVVVSFSFVWLLSCLLVFRENLKWIKKKKQTGSFLHVKIATIKRLSIELRVLSRRRW